MRIIVIRRGAPLLLLASCLSAQQNQSTTTTPVTTVPRLVRISNTFHPVDGQPPAAVESVTLSIYRDQQGGAPLWQETQNVSVDAEGRYSVLMGATATDGLPLDLLNSTEPRWLGVKFNRPGEVEQPRTQLASVPYALRASDAETLGGLPASAYQLTPSASAATAAIGTPVGASAPGSTLVAKSLKPRVTSGTANYIGLFTDATDLGNSVMYQNGAAIGLNTTVPYDYLHVRFADTSGIYTGYAVQNLGNGAASYSGMLFYDQNSALGNFQGFNNSTHEYRINNIASGGTINFMIGSNSKFYVANDGNIGIGTSTPQFNLDVTGNINLTGSLLVRGIPGLVLNGNTAVGFSALGVTSILSTDTAVGSNALAFDTTGASNTAIGDSALSNDSTGSYNTATGYGALEGYGSVVTGSDNTAAGYIALGLDTSGAKNTASGVAALFNNTTGSNNVALGFEALQENVTGTNNIAIGYQAGLNVGVSGENNNIDVGNTGEPADSGAIRIGTAGTHTSFFAAGIRGVTTGLNNAIPVVIDSNGQLGTVSSSRRFKEDIHDMGDASRGLMQLRPVTFRYKKPYADGSKPIQYGLIAEEVADVYPDLVARSADGQIETVKYQVLPVMLLNEVQRQQAQSAAQAARLQTLEQQVQEQRRELDAQHQQNQLLLERLSKLEAAIASSDHSR